MQTETTIQLTSMTFGGDALGRLPDGRAVFVPFGLPDETVKIRLWEEKTTFARGEILEVVQPSPKRISPRCPHFGVCGGCNYQHLSYPDQLAVKQKIVVDQLKRLAGLADFPVTPVVPSPTPWNYRNTVQFHVSEEGKLGYQRAGSNDFVAVSECHLPQEDINAFWPQISFEAESGIRRVVIREGSDGDLLLGLNSAYNEPPDFAVDFPISVVHTGPNAQVVLSGDEYLIMSVLGRPFKVSVGSFFQTNLPVAEKMVQHVLSLAGNLIGKTVIDAYCGVGLFSSFLAQQARHLTGIELSDSACEDYAANLDEFSNVDLYVGAVEQILPGLSEKPDLLVIDPPRAGLEKHVIDFIAKTQPDQLIYVSCDPATFARDTKRLLQAGYTLASVTPFDQFPQTFHIETISEFRLSK